MDSLLDEFYTQAKQVEEKLRYQHDILSRQVTAVEKLTDPIRSFSKGVLRPLPPPCGTQLKTAEESLLRFLQQKKDSAKDSCAGNRSILPVNQVLPLFSKTILRGHKQYSHRKPAVVFSWRDSILADIMEEVIGLVPSAPDKERRQSQNQGQGQRAAPNVVMPPWVQVSDSELEALARSIEALQSFEHPLARSGATDEGFLAAYLRKALLQQGGYKSFRARPLLSRDEWSDVIKCLSAEVAECVFNLYTTMDKTLDAALNLELTQPEKLRLVRMAADAVSLSTQLSRDLK